MSHISISVRPEAENTTAHVLTNNDGRRFLYLEVDDVHFSIGGYDFEAVAGARVLAAALTFAADEMERQIAMPAGVAAEA
jgi:hypothetical protein